MNSQYILFAAMLVSTLTAGCRARDVSPAAWKVGAPIVSYWAGPGYPGGAPMDDAAATQLAEGGWNVVWCNEKELDVVHRHGLRGLLVDSLLSGAADGNVLEDPGQLAALDALID